MTRSVELNNRSTVATSPQYGEKQSSNTTNKKFPKFRSDVFHKIESAQCVRITSLGQIMFAVQTEQKGLVPDTSRHRTQKRMERSAARGI